MATLKGNTMGKPQTVRGAKVFRKAHSLAETLCQSIDRDCLCQAYITAQIGNENAPTRGAI